MKTHSTEKPHMCDKVRGIQLGEGLAVGEAEQGLNAVSLCFTTVWEVL